MFREYFNANAWAYAQYKSTEIAVFPSDLNILRLY